MKLKQAFLLLLFGVLFSQPRVVVSIEPRTMVEGDSFTLTVKLENGDEMPSVNTSLLRDYRIVTGPSQSTNMQWINGKMSSTHSLSWTMIPKKKGQQEFPSINIRVGKQTFQSDPIKLSVLDRKDARKLKSANVPQRKFFIEASANNTNPYRGEQVTITYTLYTKTDLSGFDIHKLPRFKGFWSKELYSPTNLQLREAWVDNNKWYASVVKKIALFPTQSGVITIDPMTAIVGVREKGSRGFGFGSLFSPSKEYTIATNSLDLNIKPLPASPDKKSGAVGNWNIRSKISSTALAQDEAVTLTITLQGTGNIQAVDIQDIYFPRELEVFDPEVNVKQNEITDNISGVKTIEYVLIPRQSGNIKIPFAELVYFDLDKRQWRTKKTKEIILNVEKSSNAAAGATGLSKVEISLIDKDIHFSDLSEPDWRRAHVNMISGRSIAAVIFGFIFYIIPAVVHISRSSLDKTRGSRLARRAAKKALSELKISGEPEELYGSMHAALNTYICAKTGHQIERSSQELVEWVKSSSKEDQVTDSFKQILSRGDAVRFANISAEESIEDVKNFRTLITDLDRAC